MTFSDRRMTYALPLLLLCAALFGTSCSSRNDSRISEEGEAPGKDKPPVTVTLPPSPSFVQDHAPERYADGSYSLYGLKKSAASLDNRDVRATGFITDIYKCECAPKDKECVCKKPHFYFADKSDADKDHAILVTDYPEERAVTKAVVVGRKISIEATFGKASASGFSSSDGLLIFKSLIATPPTE